MVKVPLARPLMLQAKDGLDPRYEEEVSGCTASVGIVSKDKIWVVGRRLNFIRRCVYKLTVAGECRRLALGAGCERPSEAVIFRP